MRQTLKPLAAPGALRLALALSVVVHHFSRIAIGHAAVCVFFVLSGYWIARMWRTKYASLPSPYWSFVASRYARLLPLFLLINAFALGIAGYLDGEFPASVREWTSNLFILGYSSLQAKALVPAWSLDIEMQFYLAAPLLAAVVAWRPVLAVAAAVAISVASEILFGRMFFTSFLVFFALGIAADATEWRPAPWLAAASLSASALAFVGFVLYLPEVALGGANPDAAFAFNPQLNIGLALLLSPFALFTVRQRSGPIDRAMGDLSYAVYLLHWPAVALTGAHFGHLPPAERLPYVAGAIIATLAGSALLWAAIDRPLNRLRATITRQRSSAQAA